MSELPKKKRKTRPMTNAIKCTDESGHTYDSMLEMDVTHEFEAYAVSGYIKNINKQVCFNFKEKVNGFSRTYTADLTFDCIKTFSAPCLKPVGRGFQDSFFTFEAGKSYVVDVKSPLTYKLPLWRFKKALMKAVWGVAVVELIRRHPRKNGSSKRKKKNPGE